MGAAPPPHNSLPPLHPQQPGTLTLAQWWGVGQKAGLFPPSHSKGMQAKFQAL